MKFISFEKIKTVATIPDWIDAMDNALQTYGTEKCIMPKRMHLDYNQNTFLVMPCVMDDYWITKLVAFCPENALSEKPSIYGTVIFNDTKTGENLAIMDGQAITAMRTAAVSAVGIKNLAPMDTQSLGIVGTGFQGIYQTIFACSVRKISKIYAYDGTEKNINHFIEVVSEKYPNIDIIKANNSNEVALNSELIITATNSQNPVFENKKELFENKTIVGVGSYKPDFREFPEQLFRLTDQIFIDTKDGKTESGDLLTPIEKGWTTEDRMHPISDLLKREVALSSNTTRFYKTVGCAIFDLFAAKMIYEKYTKNTD